MHRGIIKSAAPVLYLPEFEPTSNWQRYACRHYLDFCHAGKDLSVTQMSSCRTWSAPCSRWVCTCVGGVRQSVGLLHDVVRSWQAGSVGWAALMVTCPLPLLLPLLTSGVLDAIYMLNKLSLVLSLCRFGRRRSGCAPPACRAAARLGCRRWRQSRQEDWGKH